METFPDAEAAAILTVLSQPELQFFILLTTERVTGGGGGGEKDCWFVIKVEVDHHGTHEAGIRLGPSTKELCI